MEKLSFEILKQSDFQNFSFEILKKIVFQILTFKSQKSHFQNFNFIYKIIVQIQYTFIGQMKRGAVVNFSQPAVRILLVGQHLYQVSFRNIYGYLKALLIDRCKRAGAEYRYFERSYFIHSDKLSLLKTQFQNVLQQKNSDKKVSFKIQDFPMSNIKSILKSDKKGQQNDKFKGRIIFIDRLSQNRYFYMRQQIFDLSQNVSKSSVQQQRGRAILIVTSQSNKRLCLSNVLIKKPNPSSSNAVNPTENGLQIFELTYSQLTTKRSNLTLSKFGSSLNGNKAYLITYDNLKFIQNSWFLNEIPLVSGIFIDDAQFLITGENQISTFQQKNKNFEAFRLLLKNYPIANEIAIFFSKLPQPLDLFKMLVLLKPKSFSGLKFSSSLKSTFDQNVLNPEQKAIYEEFIAWFRRRYRVQSKSFKQINFLLKSVIIKHLDLKLSKKSQILPTLLFSNSLSENCKINLVQLPSDVIQRFRAMDKKYKKLCPTINFKQILQDLHDGQNKQEIRFQIVSKIQDHLQNKHSKHYLAEAKQLMLNSKIELILRKLYFTVNTQKERIAVVIDDQRAERRFKKYFKQTQIQYVDYDFVKSKNSAHLILPSTPHQNYYRFDSNFEIKVCIINISKILNQQKDLQKMQKQKVKSQLNLGYDFGQDFQYETRQISKKIKLPKITTAQSVCYIDLFWNQFSWQKQNILTHIFDSKLSFIEEKKKQNKIQFEQVFKTLKITQSFFITEGSHQKMMIENYLARKQQLFAVKVQDNPLQKEGNKIEQFITNLIQIQNSKFSELNCEVIQFLDIDEQYDKVEQEAKKLKNLKNPQILQEKVFLPKYTKPQTKSFKQMLDQKLFQKNTEDILDQSHEFQTLLKFQMRKETQKKIDKPQNRNQSQILEEDQTAKCQILEEPFQNIKQNNICEAAQKYNSQFQYIQNSFQTLQASNSMKKLPSEPLLSKQKPHIQIQTVKLQYDQEIQPSIYERGITSNEPEKDLFDELLGQNFQFSNYHNSFDKDQQNLDEVQTLPQCDQIQDCAFSKMQRNSEPNQQIKSQILLQNFGNQAYHGKQDLFNIKSQQVRNQEAHPKKPIIFHKQQNIKQQKRLISHLDNQESLQIIETDGIIDLDAIDTKKKSCINYQGRIKRFTQKSHIKNRNSNNIPHLSTPKTMKVCSKKIYEETISKSKQLWQKKLRKQRELLILAPKRLQLSLNPKAGWKDNLTADQIRQLKEKGIQL